VRRFPPVTVLLDDAAHIGAFSRFRRTPSSPAPRCTASCHRSQADGVPGGSRPTRSCRAQRLRDTYGVYLKGLLGGARFRTTASTIEPRRRLQQSRRRRLRSSSSGDPLNPPRSQTGFSNPSMVTSGNYIGAALDSTSERHFQVQRPALHGRDADDLQNCCASSAPRNAVVKNNIFSSSMTTTLAANNKMIIVDGASQAGFSSDYNNFFSSNSNYSGTWGVGPVSLLTNWIGTTGQDAHSLSGNPLWPNPDNEEFHPAPAAGAGTARASFWTAWIRRRSTRRTPPKSSPTRKSSGARANQGSYGQTVEASLSVLPCPTTVFVRQAGDGDVTTIQADINILPNPLTGHFLHHHRRQRRLQRAGHGAELQSTAARASRSRSIRLDRAPARALRLRHPQRQRHVVNIDGRAHRRRQLRASSPPRRTSAFQRHRQRSRRPDRLSRDSALELQLAVLLQHHGAERAWTAPRRQRRGRFLQHGGDANTTVYALYVTGTDTNVVNRKLFREQRGPRRFP